MISILVKLNKCTKINKSLEHNSIGTSIHLEQDMIIVIILMEKRMNLIGKKKLKIVNVKQSEDFFRIDNQRLPTDKFQTSVELQSLNLKSCVFRRNFCLRAFVSKLQNQRQRITNMKISSQIQPKHIFKVEILEHLQPLEKKVEHYFPELLEEQKALVGFEFHVKSLLDVFPDYFLYTLACGLFKLKSLIKFWCSPKPSKCLHFICSICFQMLSHEFQSLLLG